MPHSSKANWLALALALFASSAQADATVQIMLNDHLSRPTDGKVTLKGSKTLTCTTIAGKCAVRAPGGKYSVTVVPRTAGVPTPRNVSVPSSGTARVAVSLPEKLPGRDLARGTTLSGRGTLMKGSTRRNGLLIFSKDGKSVGYVPTKDTRFNVYDLPTGTYNVDVRFGLRFRCLCGLEFCGRSRVCKVMPKLM